MPCSKLRAKLEKTPEKFEFISQLIKSNRDIDFGEAFQLGQASKPQVIFSDAYFYRIRKQILDEINNPIANESCFKDLKEFAHSYGLDAIRDLFDLFKK